MAKDPAILLAGPPVVVAAADKIGQATAWFTLGDAVKVGTLIYLTIAVAYITWKWWRQVRQARQTDLAGKRDRIQYDTDQAPP